MKRLTFLIVLLLVFGIAPAAWAGAAEEVAELIEQRVKAFNEGNLEVFMATWADNAVWTPAGSPFRVEGKEAIQSGFAGVFQTFPTRRYVPRQRSIPGLG